MEPAVICDVQKGDVSKFNVRFGLLILKIFFSVSRENALKVAELLP